MCPAAWKVPWASRIRTNCSNSFERSTVKPQRKSEPEIDFNAYPDAMGRFGDYGGVYVAETLIAPLAELSATYLKLRDDPAFQAELAHDLKHYVGRPSPIYHAERLSREVGGAQILLKREDLNHTGAHKINNTVGQAMVAKHMGKTRIIAETGAGQHGVASATAAAYLDLECVVYMGEVDTERQALNVARMRML
ncbi:MAG: pyridoxal-phosphate dependent enzyme, partial [Pseudomonadota bacterium]|nr:pyridoxal-phosphate dependent enzyme [Pseudomonadota bacterium]